MKASIFCEDEASHQVSPSASRRSMRRGMASKAALMQTLLVLGLTILQRNKSASVQAADLPKQQSANQKAQAKHWDPLEKTVQDHAANVLEEYHHPHHFFRHNSEYANNNKNSDDTRENILIVTAVDGTLAGISMKTGKTIWKRTHHNELQTTRSVSEAPLFAPLLSTSTTTRTPPSDWRTSAVPSVDGKVHLTAPYLEPSEALDDRTDVTVTTTVHELVARAPFVDNRGRIYTGSRRTLAVAMNVETGEVLRVVSADAVCLEEDTTFDDNDRVVWLGRVDQSVSIQDPKTGEVDVRFSAGQIMSVHDMVLGSGARQPSRSSPVLLATPSGVLAYMNDAGQVLWMAEDFFDSPVASAVEATSGLSLPVHIVPDATVANGSPEYLKREIQRQVDLLGQETASTDVEEDGQTIFGTLPSGELFAMPIGSDGRLKSLLGQKTQQHIAGTTQPLIDASQQQQQRNPETNKRPQGFPAGCRPGTPGFPSCLVGSPDYKDPFARPLAGSSIDDSAVVPFYHPDFGYFPPEHFYIVTEKPRNRRFRKLLALLASWIAPTSLFILVAAFELGRRVRQQEQERITSINGIASTHVSGSHSAHKVIQVYDDIILGYGGHGTVVYKGLLDGREVAVKRMLKAYHASADREISLLIESDGHPNVVRYFLKELRGDFVYLALELCDMSLHDLISNIKCQAEQIESDTEDLLSNATKTILYQLVCGVRHIHRLRIVHRDLKPANILLAKARTTKTRNEDRSVFEAFLSGEYVAKISDMGLGKQLVGHSSYGASLTHDASVQGQSNGGQSSVAGGPGTVGWQAPEVMALRVSSDTSTLSDGSNVLSGDSNPDSSTMEAPAGANRTSRSVDIFSLGCIFCSTIVPGKHPFGEWYEREANIMRNRPSIDVLKDVSAEAYDLVSGMIQRNPTARPTAAQICEHPFFWTRDRRLTFLCDFSDRLEMESDEEIRRANLLAVERGAAQIVGTSWDSMLDNELVSNVQRFRTYDPSSVRDILRLIRNKYHHFDELPATMKEAVKNKAEGLDEYFESRFPNLLIHCYNVCRERLEKSDPLCTKYSIYQQRIQKTKRIARHISLVEEVPIDDVGTPEVEEAVPRKMPSDDTSKNIAPDTMAGDSTSKKEKEQSSVAKGEAKAPATVPSDDCSDWPSEMEDVIIWHGSSAAKSFNCRGWSRSDNEWERSLDTSLRKRDINLVRCAKDPKFRTRLCNHWDESYGTSCPMKRKNKCVFAHGPIELRVKEGKRNRWGRLVDDNGDNNNPKHSGGEDTYGAARSIETERKQEGKWKTGKNSTAKPKSKTPRKKTESPPALPAAASIGAN